MQITEVRIYLEKRDALRGFAEHHPGQLLDGARLEDR
jgi:hypothetical protein